MGYAESEQPVCRLTPLRSAPLTDLPDERLAGELDDESAARVQGGARARVRDRLGHQVPRRARAVRR